MMADTTGSAPQDEPRDEDAQAPETAQGASEQSADTSSAASTAGTAEGATASSAPAGDDGADAGADAATGETGETAADETSPDAEESGESSREDKLLDELQRLAAEYKNYRQRTEAQRERDHALAVGDAAKRLFPVFDDLDRAEQAGDLAEGSAFATIASKLRGVGEGLGLERFGAKGEPFDPNLHEAVLQQHSPDVHELVIGEVVQPGYRIGDTLLRAAKVVVLAPAE